MGSLSLPAALTHPRSVVVDLLLESRIPARMAWVAGDGDPRVVPIWFWWNGEALVLSTFAGARKLADIVDGTVFAVTIDSEDFPYRSLRMRGPVIRRSSSGLAAEYRAAAARYLGPNAAARWCEFLGDPAQVALVLTPHRASFSDMAVDSPFFAGSAR